MPRSSSGARSTALSVRALLGQELVLFSAGLDAAVSMATPEVNVDLFAERLTRLQKSWEVMN